MTFCRIASWLWTREREKEREATGEGGGGRHEGGGVMSLRSIHSACISTGLGFPVRKNVDIKLT